MSGSPSKRPVSKCKSEMTSLSKLYLVGYNGLQTVGWTYVFIQSMRYVLQNRSTVGLYDKHGLSLLIFQSLAGLEVLHALVGLVSSNPYLTAVQVSSRLYQIWGILYSIPEVQDSPSIAVLAFAWGLTEIVRYSYYTINLLQIESNFLTWCRYSLFYALYPSGVSGELYTIWKALSVIKKKQLYSLVLPNAANISFSYYYANIFLMLTYIPLFPVMFNHMRRQRVKVLGRTKPSQKKLG